MSIAPTTGMMTIRPITAVATPVSLKTMTGCLGRRIGLVAYQTFQRQVHLTKVITVTGAMEVEVDSQTYLRLAIALGAVLAAMVETRSTMITSMLVVGPVVIRGPDPTTQVQIELIAIVLAPAAVAESRTAGARNSRSSTIERKKKKRKRKVCGFWPTMPDNAALLLFRRILHCRD